MNSRAMAASVVGRVLTDHKSLTAALDEFLPTIPKDSDRAFVQAMSFGVLRWYPWLDAVLSRLAKRPIQDPTIRILALLGLYQLHFSRVQPHAAVAETVAAAAGRMTWAKPFLNGVLRSFQRDGHTIIHSLPATDTIRYSHPQWLLEKIRADWPEQADSILERGNEQAPLTLRVNRQHDTRAAYLQLLAESTSGALPCRFSADGIKLTQPIPVDRLPGFGQGRVSVQDEAAQLAVPLLGVQPTHRVLDLCAAPGGKTLHILESCPALRELVALDLAEERLKKVRENLSRAGLTATLRQGDATRPEDWWDGEGFDAILLDAPCSATGVIRRHPDIKWLRRAEDIDQLVRIQARILDAVWPLLKTGGTLLYATCSILKAENESQIAAFLQRTPAARESRIEVEWGSPSGHGRQIVTGDHDMDGFFYARMTKVPV